MHITKRTLVKGSFGRGFNFFMSFSLVVDIIFLVVSLFHNGSIVPEDDDIWFYFMFPLTILIFMAIMYITITAPCLMRLKEMEKELGIDLDSSLKGKRMRRDQFVNRDWFIFITGVKFIALNRKYIKELVAVDATARDFTVVFRTPAQKLVKWKVLHIYNIENKFKAWIRRDDGKK